jgi:hypothetical protein
VAPKPALPVALVLRVVSLALRQLLVAQRQGLRLALPGVPALRPVLLVGPALRPVLLVGPALRPAPRPVLVAPLLRLPVRPLQQLPLHRSRPRR